MPESQPNQDVIVPPEPIRLAANAVKARLFGLTPEGPSRSTRLAISGLLSYFVEGADRSEAFKAKRWDGRSTFFDFNTATFPAGFATMVARELERLGHRVQMVQKPLPAPLGAPAGTVDYLGYGFLPRYDYQVEAVTRLLSQGRMIARIATGGGKSQVAVLATGALRRPTLFLTTRTVLAHQMASTFERAGFTPGFLGDGHWAPRKGVNMGMVQTLQERLNLDHPLREKTLQLLSYFEFVIAEEAHETGGAGYFSIMQALPNAHYRLALTATAFMRADEEANMRLMGSVGPIGIDVSEALLIERGILARPIFKIVHAPGPATMRRGTTWPTCYELGVVENPERNRVIVYEAHRAAAHKLPVLVLITRKKHGEILRKSCEAAGLRVEFIFGAHEANERKDALKRLESGETQVLIGSSILDVGVDVPALGLVVLAGGGKAEVATRQRIGRGLREKKSGPNICHILDFSDRFNRILQGHGEARRGVLLQTPGFAENILPEGKDFDYARFL